MTGPWIAWINYTRFAQGRCQQQDHFFQTFSSNLLPGAPELHVRQSVLRSYVLIRI